MSKARMECVFFLAWFISLRRNLLSVDFCWCGTKRKMGCIIEWDNHILRSPWYHDVQAPMRWVYVGSGSSVVQNETIGWLDRLTYRTLLIKSLKSWILLCRMRTFSWKRRSNFEFSVANFCEITESRNRSNWGMQKPAPNLFSTAEPFVAIRCCNSFLPCNCTFDSHYLKAFAYTLQFAWSVVIYVGCT